MPASDSQPTIIRFGVFDLNPQAGELRKAGHRVSLRPQAARLLALLARRPGQILTREELKDEIWGKETFVDFEHGLNLCIRQIREALGDDADTPRYIETLPRRGYRFIAPVEPTARAASPVALLHGVPTRKHFAWHSATLIAGITLIIGISVAIADPYEVREHLFGGLTRARTIAVLPLLNLSGDANQDYFADGMTEALTTDLARMETVQVISRSSAMQYKGVKKPLPTIAGELHADAIVEGSVQRVGNRVRVTAQLIRAATD